MERNTNKDGWHLDKKVPISIIVTLLVQFVGGIVFLSKLDSRVEALELARLEEKATQRDRDDRQDLDNAGGFARTQAQLEKMDAKLDRLIESRR